MVAHEKEHALYKGEKLLGIGTVKELAELEKVKEATIHFYASPTYAKRTNEQRARRLVKV